MDTPLCKDDSSRSKSRVEDVAIPFCRHLCRTAIRLGAAFCWMAYGQSLGVFPQQCCIGCARTGIPSSFCDSASGGPVGDSAHPLELFQNPISLLDSI